MRVQGLLPQLKRPGADALFTAIGTAANSIITTDFGVNTTANNVDYVFVVTSIKEEDSFSLYLNDTNRNFTVKGILKVKVYAL